MKRILTFLTVCLSSVISEAQLHFLSAPMLAHVDMKEANLVVQVSEKCRYELEYWPESAQGVKKKKSGECSDAVFFTERIVIDDLDPATLYRYSLRLINERGESAAYPATDSDYAAFRTEALWQFRTDAPDFTFATGSCAFINEPQYDRPGKPYGNDYGIFDAIAAKKPDLMVWLGDNVYFREVDFESRQTMIRRYQQIRALPEMQKLLSVCPHYAIWDDHDFGPNDSNGSFIHKSWALEIFREFWANEAYSWPGEGVTGQFAYSDVEFFLLDNRWFRTLPDMKGIEPTILGKEQWEWFKLALGTSRATFKFVAIGGQFLNTEKKFENYSNYVEERRQIIDFIESNGIKNVFFLTGDRHCTEFSEMSLANGHKIYDLTSSPLTSGAYDNTKENNTLRVPGTIVAEQNFALLQVKGPKNQRILHIQVFDSKGQLKWEKSVPE